MRSWPQCFARSAAIAAVTLAAAAAARAESWPLELKRLDQKTPPGYGAGGQGFQGSIGDDGKGRVTFFGDKERKAAFDRVITQEPKYECARPFRGVVTLGSQQFGFAVDMLPPKPVAEEKKPEAKDKKAEAKKSPEDKAKPEAKSGAATARARGRPVQSPPGPKTIYRFRLYFDANGNGDLTDDKVLEVESVQPSNANYIYIPLQFPQINLTIKVSGKEMDYAFRMGGNVTKRPDFSFIALTLTAAAYREGDITLDGTKHHVVLIDANSNGCFNDLSSAHNGNLTEGDALLVDPGTPGPRPGSPYDPRLRVAKLVNIDDRFYDLKVSPTGDKITLTPSTAPLGNVTIPCDGFRGTIYSEQAVLSIHGDKDTPIALPAGKWWLHSYTLDMTGRPKPAAEKKDEAKKGPPAEKSVPAVQGVPDVQRPAARYSYTMVSAQAGPAYKPIHVVAGETVAMPFGPPYTPSVAAFYMGGGDNRQAQLQMSLLGSAGEKCTMLLVDGGRPPKPEFTITDPQGKVVQSGNFEYG